MLKKQNITVASAAPTVLRSWLDRYHLTQLIAPDRFYPTNRHAAQAYRQSPERTTAEPDSSAVHKRDDGGNK